MKIGVGLRGGGCECDEQGAVMSLEEVSGVRADEEQGPRRKGLEGH